MFNGPSPIAYPSYSRGNNSGYQWIPTQNLNMVNPQEVELMMKQKFNQSQIQQMPQMQMSDPYQDFQSLMSNCAPNIRYKIMNDKEYQECDKECEILIRQAIEEAVIPYVLQQPQGRIAFEKFLATAKQLKEKFSQEEMQTTEQLQRLMQDEVVQQRLKELGQQSINKMQEVQR